LKGASTKLCFAHGCSRSGDSNRRRLRLRVIGVSNSGRAASVIRGCSVSNHRGELHRRLRVDSSDGSRRSALSTSQSPPFELQQAGLGSLPRCDLVLNDALLGQNACLSGNPQGLLTQLLLGQLDAVLGDQRSQRSS
jgi:hypothetical protein